MSPIGIKFYMQTKRRAYLFRVDAGGQRLVYIVLNEEPRYSLSRGRYSKKKGTIDRIRVQTDRICSSPSRTHGQQAVGRGVSVEPYNKRRVSLPRTN